jgi:hypothetical protein
MNFKLPLVLCVTISCMLVVLPGGDALAGYRRCVSYPDNTSACVDESGFRFDCNDYEGGARSICTGKNNYRKECSMNFANNTGFCNDSNGVRTTCKHSDLTSVCENSRGFRSVCRSYDFNTSICTDVSRWGKPIQN